MGVRARRNRLARGRTRAINVGSSAARTRLRQRARRREGSAFPRSAAINAPVSNAFLGITQRGDRRAAQQARVLLAPPRRLRLQWWADAVLRRHGKPVVHLLRLLGSQASALLA